MSEIARLAEKLRQPEGLFYLISTLTLTSKNNSTWTVYGVNIFRFTNRYLLVIFM